MSIRIIEVIFIVIVAFLVLFCFGLVKYSVDEQNAFKAKCESQNGTMITNGRGKEYCVKTDSVIEVK